MARRHSLAFRLTFALLVLTLIASASYKVWFPVIGGALVNDEGPSRADVAIVLAGDMFGHRIEKAGELIRAGYSPAALISGPYGLYGNYECDLAIAYAVKRGFPGEWFIPVRNTARSTQDEAHLFVAELRRRNVHSFLLLTSDYHTARAARIFRAAIRESGGGLEFRTVAAPDEYFRAASWWKTRASQKIVFIEWSKTFATAVGM